MSMFMCGGNWQPSSTLGSILVQSGTQSPSHYRKTKQHSKSITTGRGTQKRQKKRGEIKLLMKP